MNMIKKFIEQWTRSDLDDEAEPKPSSPFLYEEHRVKFDHDMSILGDESEIQEERVQKKAEREVRDAAKDSLKQLHVIQKGRCPRCGAYLHQHFFSSICNDCGWHTYETPRKGPVRIHLSNSRELIEGDRCYVLKTGEVLVIQNEVVFARIPSEAVSWIEYVWKPDEIEQRYKQAMGRLKISCGWCTGDVDPEKDGFHLVHSAFGSTQERYCFCSDECYEAFRKMYPARVHRNCYERSCVDCDLCDKRYPEGGDCILTFMKDFLATPGRKKKDE
ncbi:MAG: hypothetical protein GX811_05835 [Lentisphaerae bacterium]|nr:hypothetical protein [Lentisphaerota bacterium]